VATGGGVANSATDFTVTVPAVQSISGVITAGGTAQVGAVVSAFDATTHAFVRSVFTNGSGAYSITGIPAGNYHLRFTSTTPANLTQFYDHKGTIDTANVIEVAGEQAKTVSADLYRIVAPTVTDFSPGSATVGTTISISGTGFTNATSVRFNGVATSFAVDSPTAIRAEVPAGATTGKISVTTPDGTGTSVANFTVLQAPTITGFLPTSGSVGTTVTINGTNLSGATSVTFNGTLATSVQIVNANQIKAAVPAGATDGAIAVTTPGGTATSAGSFTVTIAPTVQNVRGTISSDAGPMANVVVSAFDATTHAYVKGVFTNASGEYTLPLPAGVYHLRFTGTTPSNLTQFYNHSVTITGATPIQVDSGATTWVSSNLSPL
jgi:hypothetical protein